MFGLWKRAEDHRKAAERLAEQARIKKKMEDDAAELAEKFPEGCLVKWWYGRTTWDFHYGIVLQAPKLRPRGTAIYVQVLLFQYDGSLSENPDGQDVDIVEYDERKIREWGEPATMENTDWRSMLRERQNWLMKSVKRDMESVEQAKRCLKDEMERLDKLPKRINEAVAKFASERGTAPDGFKPLPETPSEDFFKRTRKKKRI